MFLASRKRYGAAQHRLYQRFVLAKPHANTDACPHGSPNRASNRPADRSPNGRANANAHPPSFALTDDLTYVHADDVTVFRADGDPNAGTDRVPHRRRRSLSVLAA